MLAVIKYWPIALSALISLFIGYNVGHYFGVKTGAKIEAGNNAVITAKEAVKSQSIKEKNHAATSRLSHDDVNSGLAALGLLRDAKGD